MDCRYDRGRESTYISFHCRSGFINIWSIVFGFATQFVYFMMPGRHPLEVHLCAGTNPELDSQQTKINVNILTVYIISLVVNVVIAIRIRIFRSKNLRYSPTEAHNLTDLTTSLSMIAMMSVIVSSLVFAADIKPASLNTYPYYFTFPMVQLISPNLVTFSVMVTYYSRNKTMRSILLRNLKESMLQESF